MEAYFVVVDDVLNLLSLIKSLDSSFGNEGSEYIKDALNSFAMRLQLRLQLRHLYNKTNKNTKLMMEMFAKLIKIVDYCKNKNSQTLPEKGKVGEPQHREETGIF